MAQKPINLIVVRKKAANLVNQFNLGNPKFVTLTTRDQSQAQSITSRALQYGEGCSNPQDPKMEHKLDPTDSETVHFKITCLDVEKDLHVPTPHLP